jgi:hypothetical protein
LPVLRRPHHPHELAVSGDQRSQLPSFGVGHAAQLSLDRLSDEIKLTRYQQ